MSIPQPKQALEGHCSAIHDETLYVLSPSGLQSLPLKEDAEWSKEASGTLVTGAACVKAEPGGGEAVLYVIGGTTEDGGFGGLQRYHFSSKEWETLETPVNVLSGRTNHSAAYLEDSESILVYAGSQPNAPSWLSSQTFVVHTSSPYNVDSFTSSAPPANQPIIQPLNSTHVVMAGGSETSNGIFTFDTTTGWNQLGTNLTEPLQPGVRGTIISGSDGSKVLETYDMSSSPNTVTQTVLLGPGGQVAETGETVGSLSSRKRKRELTLDNWPSYNSTGAPTTQRDDYSVAQDADGMAVASGGSTDQPVSLFSQTDNSWIDTSKFFNGDQTPLTDPSSTSSISTSATPTSSSEPSASSTEAAAGGLSPHDKMLRTLGITLGVLCGIAACFIFALLFVRMRKAKRRKQEGYVDENEKSGGNNDRLSFADRGASFMKEAGGSISNPTPPPGIHYDGAGGAGSHSSLAIIGGRFGNRRSVAHGQKGSFESTTRLVRDRNGDMEMLDIGDKKHELERKPVQSSLAPPTQVYGASAEDDKSGLNNRSSGWSRYFAASQPEGVAHLPSAYVKDRQSDASEWPSSGHSSSAMSRIPSSALVPPLNIDFSKTVDGQRLSNVVKGSPAFANSEEDLARRGSPVEGHKAMFEDGDRPLSKTDTVSSYDRSTMSTDYYNGLSSGNTPWTPVSNNFKDHLTQSRPSSSLYTNSMYDPQRNTYEHQRLPSRAARSQNSGFFPGAGTTVKPPKIKTGHHPTPSTEWPTVPGATKDSPLLKSPPPIQAPSAMPRSAHDRASTATVFPHNNGNRWTANVSKDATAGALHPPRAPALTGGAKESLVNDRDSTVTVFPMNDGNAWTANASKNELQPPRAPGLAQNDAQPADNRDSTQTMFPRGVPSAYYANRPKELEDESNKKPMDTDMSWLNLGLGGHRS